MGTIMKGGLLGGAIVFFWSYISWAVLPWHLHDFKQFEDEQIIRETLPLGAVQAGIYMIPDPKQLLAVGFPDKSLPEEMGAAASPYAFVVFHPDGITATPLTLLRALLIQTAGAMIVTGLLLLSGLRLYLGRVFFVILFALGAGTLCYLPQWNWWGFPAPFILKAMADLLIGWFLAALAIAALTAPARQVSGLRSEI